MEAADIRIEHVDLSYGAVQVLRNVNLEIRAGEFFAFLGPSGCGKTTLLRLIAGFNTAQKGRVLVGGADISHLPPWKRDVGMVFQSYALWPHMSVGKNVAFGLEERRLPRGEIEVRVEEALRLVGLAHLKDRKPSQLSGGQQQRVALARTIAVRPKVLLLDEPLSNLDAKMRVQVRREIRELQQELGLTTIFVTHDQEEANTICDRIAVMQDGRIEQVGSPMALYDRPENLFVAGFLGTANILSPVAAANGRVTLPGGAEMDALVAKGSKLMFRPQNARIGTRLAKPAPETIRFEGLVAHREFLGSTVRYAVRIGESEVLVDIAHRADEKVLETGDTAVIDVERGQIRWLTP